MYAYYSFMLQLGASALSKAVSGGFVDCVKVLLEFKPKLNELDKMGVAVRRI